MIFKDAGELISQSREGAKFFTQSCHFDEGEIFASNSATKIQSL
jgi:hypothetical protein